MTDENAKPREDPNAHRKRVSFAEAEGVRGPPRQLKLREISRELRAKIWSVLFDSLRSSSIRDFDRTRISGEWLNVLFHMHVNIEFKAADEFPNELRYHADRIKQLIWNGNYVDVFDFIEMVLRNYRTNWILSRDVGNALESSRAAYRIVDRDTIVPITSETDLQTFERAVTDLSSSEFNGARTHLKQAASKLSSGNFADSVRESIHAVESLARSLAPSNKLSDSLAILERNFSIHAGLKSGFNAIYGYTSNQQGIRHPLLDEDAANVDEADALFMLGACSAFISYLILKTNGK